MRMRVMLPAAIAVLLLVGVAAEARQQGGSGGQAPPQAGGDTLDLVFEREVFYYPDYQRRNPFRPLTGDESGPRFEELRLVGILYSDEPSQSIAVLGVAGGQRAALRTYRVRVGETLGNSRILEIRREQVVVAVDEFGVVETRILEVQRPDWAAREAEAMQIIPDTAADTIPLPPPGGEGGVSLFDSGESWNGGSR